MPVGISNTVLLLCESFGGDLDANRVARALARGITAGGWASDVCALAAGERGELDRLDFDRRMREARAVVIAVRELDDRTLAGSVAFEAATRARQSGVPAYAVAAENRLDPFEARIVDLQVVLQAGGVRALGAAGRELGGLL